MIPASSYVLGRIGDSETSVQTNSAVAGVLDNAATSETKYKASEELINVTKEITTNASANKLFDTVKVRTTLKRRQITSATNRRKLMIVAKQITQTLRFWRMKLKRR
ncbi:hypothetical protein DPMN_039451 [Dreissena polymorpha]|uniref:Uncharacterized protein n=1 Tax=Dreissena polymorpha TaxID=45954 RepID=A0A9D4HU11_DREPO|nr:hypothetical protein DPMN_039451 [Dreissena polymorpha]